MMKDAALTDCDIIQASCLSNHSFFSFNMLSVFGTPTPSHALGLFEEVIIEFQRIN